MIREELPRFSEVVFIKVKGKIAMQSAISLRFALVSVVQSKYNEGGQVSGKPNRGFMSLLIDGYNLIFGTSVASSGPGGALQRMRTGLVDFLVTCVDRSKFKSITVVFDAANAPPGLSSTFEERGIHVHFARDHADADELIEHLIAASSSPGRLTVVSSDHRVQRAAKRRGATAVDSDLWFREQIAISQRKPKAREVKPSGPLSAAETDAWVRYFGEFEVAESTSDFGGTAAKPRSSQTETNRTDAPAPRKNRPKARETKSEKELTADLANPFPPGYANDLFRDERKL